MPSKYGKQGDEIMIFLDKVEAFLIKSFLVLAGCVLVFQVLAKKPVLADLLILLHRLEGAVYQYSGIQ